jgi:hypothetical protein
MLMMSDDKTCAGAASTKIYIGDLVREQVVRAFDFQRDSADVTQVC